MASNNAFKITKDTSARKNTRVGSIQSAVEAAAMKESHDYYVNRLTEGYKQQLETMEQGYEDQVRELKTQYAASLEKTKKEAIEEATAKAAENLKAADVLWVKEVDKCDRLGRDYTKMERRALNAEETYASLVSSHRTEINEQRKKHKAELDRAHRESKTGPYSLIEVKFAKRNKSNNIVGTPKLVVKRSGVMFSELVKAGLKPHSTPSWRFEYKGNPLTDMEKTLTQVSACTSIF